VTLTIILLPGLFGFFVWELKENWKLYQANHRDGLSAAPEAAVKMADIPVEPAAVGPHGERVRGLMARGFHSGGLPKAFDRLRKVLAREMRDGQPYPHRLRRVQRHLNEIEHAFGVFFERELIFALRERCADPNCTLQRVETVALRMSTNLVELSVDIYPGAARDGVDTALASRLSENPPLRLEVRLFHRKGEVQIETDVAGHTERIGPYCWSLIAADLTLFAGRAGADLKTLHLGLPAPPAETLDAPTVLRAVA
jgi:hypothetical protein